jgi:TolB-like protein/DNA-binding winged helix-turn-helix (wHTH) protein
MRPRSNSGQGDRLAEVSHVCGATAVISFVRNRRNNANFFRDLLRASSEERCATIETQRYPQSRSDRMNASPRYPSLAAQVYLVSDLRVDVGQQRVTREQVEISLPKLSFDLLLALIRTAPNLVSNDELMTLVWPDRVVSLDTVNQRVKLLRDALGDDAHNPRYVAGLRGRGYRLVGPVTSATSEQGDRAAPSDRSLGSLRLPPAVPSSPAPSGVVPSGMQPLRRPRRAVLAVLAAVLVLATGTTVYIYFPRTGPEVAGVRPPIHSLAVLPLENLSGDKEQEYFAEGMTDALTTDLAQIGALRVISRTSAMQFKASKETLPQIGRDLEVDAVVEGTVTRGENRVRVTAQLVEASSDRHLWARTYERDLKDVLALQDEIAQDIAGQIRVKLSPEEHSLIIQARAVDPEAYDAYLRGSYWLSQLSLEGWKKGCDYIQKAIAKDPTYAPAYLGVAQCGDSPEEAKKAIAKALVLDPSLAEAHTWLATTKFAIDWDWSGAEAEHKQAIALNPNCAAARSWYSFYLTAMGRLDEAIREIQHARDLDPYSADISLWLGQVLYHSRRYDDALREMGRGLEMHPDTPKFYGDMADVYEQKKMFAQAFAARQQGLILDKNPKVTALSEAYKRSGYKGYLLKQAEFEESHNPALAAHSYALLNDEPRAIAALEVAYKKHHATILFMRTAPEFDSIRSSPRFRELVRRIGFPPPTSDKN